MNKTSMADLFRAMGYNYEEMEYNKPVDVSEKNFYILSFDPESGGVKECLIKKIIRKNPASVYRLETDSGLTLEASGDHEIAITDESGSVVTFISLRDLVRRSDYFVMTMNGPERAKVRKANRDSEILDIEVDDTHTYWSNGILSHNSLYGPDLDTVGGEGWKYACSVRIAMKKGKKIEAKDSLGTKIVGIRGKLQVVKNRLRAPFAEAEFDIYFDRGIDPVSGLFEVLVQEGVITPRLNDKGGVTKGWWTYKDTHFQKSKFPEILEKYPELLAGHQPLDVSDTEEVEEYTEEEDADI